MTDAAELTASTDLSQWIGRSEIRDERIGATPLQALDATLDHPPGTWPEGAPLPPLWHWLFFLPLARADEIGEDGHPRRGGFLPPGPLPRRMWAGSRFEFRAPLRVGDGVQRRSTISDVKSKQGRAGALVFVEVRHELFRAGEAAPAIVEFHDIVYRAARRLGEAEAPPRRSSTPPSWRRELVPDDVLLFRYSALTFNGHRIHYDRRYAMQVEGYPGLVVHGPLIATLLLDLLRRDAPTLELARFAFKAVRPSFDGRRMAVNASLQSDGRSLALWAEDDQGWLTMEATATLR